MSTRKETTKEITDTMFLYYAEKRNHSCVREFQFRGISYTEEMRYVSEMTLPLGKQIYNMAADLMCYDNQNGNVTIVEVKSCREDFTSDKKHHIYQEFCNFMYFAIKGDYINKSELPDNVGLIDISSGKPKFIKRAKRTETKVDKFELLRNMVNSYTWRECRWIKGNK